MAPGAKKIYIVDDSLFIISRIKALLDEIGIIGEVHMATGYREALKLFANEEPDIAVLDIHLPDGNGIDLLEYLKKYHPAVMVIMMSNQATPHHRALCKNMGASYFIDKSTEFDMLPEILISHS